MYMQPVRRADLLPRANVVQRVPARPFVDGYGIAQTRVPMLQQKPAALRGVPDAMAAISFMRELFGW